MRARKLAGVPGRPHRSSRDSFPIPPIAGRSSRGSPSRGRVARRTPRVPAWLLGHRASRPAGALARPPGNGSESHVRRSRCTRSTPPILPRRSPRAQPPGKGSHSCRAPPHEGPHRTESPRSVRSPTLRGNGSVGQGHNARHSRTSPPNPRVHNPVPLQPGMS